MRNLDSLLFVYVVKNNNIVNYVQSIFVTFLLCNLADFIMDSVNVSEINMQKPSPSRTF